MTIPLRGEGEVPLQPPTAAADSSRHSSSTTDHRSVSSVSSGKQKQDSRNRRDCSSRCGVVANEVVVANIKQIHRYLQILNFFAKGRYSLLNLSSALATNLVVRVCYEIVTRRTHSYAARDTRPHPTLDRERSFKFIASTSNYQTGVLKGDAPRFSTVPL